VLILRPRARRRAVRALESDSETARFHAIGSLGRVGGKRATDILVEVALPHLSGKRVLTTDLPIKYRYAAVHALRSKHAVPALIDALEDDGVVDAAISSLGRIGDRRATEALGNLLRRHLSEARTSGYPLCVAAVNALGSIGDHAAAPALSAALKPRQWGHLAPEDQSRDLEQAAAMALAALGGTDAIEPLVSHLAERGDLFVAEAIGRVADVAAAREAVAPVARDIARGIKEPGRNIHNEQHLATHGLLRALGPAGSAAWPEIVEAIAHTNRPEGLMQTLAKISPLGDARAVDPVLRSLFACSRVSLAMAPFDDFETVLRGLIPVSTLTDELVTLALDAVSKPSERVLEYSTATSDRAVARLCQMRWRTASNILNLVTRKQDESLRDLRLIDSPWEDTRVRVSFAHQRKMAKAELARRNHGTYRPDAYLLPGERAAAVAYTDEITSKLDSLLDYVKADDSARRQFLDLLDKLGKEHPLTPTYRRKLTSRLF
jgi:hypothetical protein